MTPKKSQSQRNKETPNPVSSPAPAVLPAPAAVSKATGMLPAQEAAPAKSFPIVGIGASAGGLQALTSFFRALAPDTGMAFVLVQHMDPSHESMLDKLLARDTAMPVTQVADGMSVEANCVYVIPPNTEMTISGGILKLVARSGVTPWHTPIDTFLCSLAEDQKMRAIGIILSGIGSDGTKGLQAIKGEGGITFAQNEESSSYAGMPLHAVAAGCVDLVLPPDQIAGELARMILHPYLQLAPQAVESELPAAGDGNLSKIFLLLRAATGVDFTNYKQTTIRRRIARRMVLRRCEKVGQYAKFVGEHPEEVQALFEDLLIQVTSFFRDPRTYHYLKSEVFPKICAALDPGEPIRIWVPGCSSGEEVYSIAMVLHEFLGETAAQTSIQIFATDVSNTAIQKARAAVYSEAAIAEVAPERLRRFFVKGDNGYRITKMIRDCCVFARHDVIKDPPFSRMDLVSCRNLLIYLELVLQKRVLTYLHYALKPTGFLVLGKTETVSAMPELFTLENREANVYSRLTSAARVPPEFRSFEHGKKIPIGVLTAVNPVVVPAFDLRREAERAILEQFAPPALVVDASLQVVYVQGDTSPFVKLFSGPPSFNLLKLVRPELMLEVRMAVQEAKKSHRTARRENVRFKRDGQADLTDIAVVPLGRIAKDAGFVVLFKHPRPVAGKVAVKAARQPRTKEEATQVELLKRDLAVAQESLRAVVQDQEATDEELRAANEELLSSNEELQSTNEELQTTKEEVQSSNEELTTLNAELQNRNVEIAKSAHELSRLLNAVEIPALILDNNRCLRHYSPAAVTLFNLISSDIGHPISRIKPNLELVDLDQVAAEVARTMHPVEKEVRDKSGHWYALRGQNYKTPENKVEGILISVVDIHDMKQLSSAIVETINEPLLVLDSGFRVLSANAAFYQKFKVAPEETENRLLFNLGNGQWNIPQLRELLETVLPNKKVIENFRVAHDFPEIGHKVMSLNARQLYQDRIGTQKVLLAIEDLTDRNDIGAANCVAAEAT